MNLDENSNYKLTKIGVKDFRKNRNVDPGETLIGTVSLIQSGHHKMLLVTRGFDFLRTSPIVNIQDQENGNFLIETANSYYSLEKLNNGEEKK